MTELTIGWRVGDKPRVQKVRLSMTKIECLDCNFKASGVTHEKDMEVRIDPQSED